MSDEDEDFDLNPPRRGGPGFTSGFVTGAALTFFIMWRRKSALRSRKRQAINKLRRREVRVEGSTCYLGGVETDCEELVSRIKEGQTVHIDATLGSQGVVDDLIERLQDAGVEVYVTSE